jgi:multidrug resistance protein, MATE family
MKLNLREGESFRDIISLWLPEIITQIVIVSLSPLVDGWLIANLKSNSMYSALSAANNFLHILLKFSDALPIAAIAVIGRYNGAKEYSRCGKRLGDIFWISTLIGFVQFVLIFFFANHIYRMLGLSGDAVEYGASFLRIRSLGFFFLFVSVSFLGFIKGIKNTKVPMLVNVIGVILFVFFDYALVLGKFGFPQLFLKGSAIATVIQYFTVATLYFVFIISNNEYKKYFPSLFFGYFSMSRALSLINRSWPIMVDKTSLAFVYAYFFKMITPIGDFAIFSFETIKNLERTLFLQPAAAFAFVIAFLVSNRLGAKDVAGASANIKKIFLVLACVMIIPAIIVVLVPGFFIGFFDPSGKYLQAASSLLVLVVFLDAFDMMQLIFAGALRGAGDVFAVMLIRIFCCWGFFIPVITLVSTFEFPSPFYKLVVLYLILYSTHMLMGFAFFFRLASGKWKKIKI